MLEDKLLTTEYYVKILYPDSDAFNLYCETHSLKRHWLKNEWLHDGAAVYSVRMNSVDAFSMKLTISTESIVKA